MIKTMNNNFYLYENNIRESGNNELVFGEPGQGQTICLKQELLQFAAKHMSNTEDKFQVFVIDKRGELLSLTNVSKGYAISIKDSGVDIFEKCNSIKENEDEGVRWSRRYYIAFDFAVALCEQLYRECLSDRTKSYIYDIVRRMYEDNGLKPTMLTFYNELSQIKDSSEINNLCEYIKLFCKANNTPEEKENKLIVYDLHEFPGAYMGAAYVFCLLDIYKHMKENYKNGIKTYVYIESMYQFFSFDGYGSADILSHMWITARMHNASFYGICDDISILKTSCGSKILMCTQNIRIFHLNSYDCDLVKKIFGFSDEESLLILKLHPGNGLFVRDNNIYPFGIFMGNVNQKIQQRNKKKQEN